MCRFTLYLGPPVLLSAILLDPSHSLIRQSVQSRERSEPLNGDGFGVGWYAPEFSEEPAVFRSITPAWNNRNLHNLARVVSSNCILAHVRAATQSSGVNDANCHPFRYKNFLCMHNGDIGNFRKVRRRMLESVCDEAYSNVYGSTDSEHFFAVVIDELLKHEVNSANDLAVALDSAISRINNIVEMYGDDEPSYLNVAITDGKHAVVSRYTNDPESEPETLYYFTGKLYEYSDPDEPAYEEIVISSERLTNEAGWQAVPANHLVILNPGLPPQLVPCGESSRKQAA